MKHITKWIDDHKAVLSLLCTVTAGVLLILALDNWDLIIWRFTGLISSLTITLEFLSLVIDQIHSD